MYINNIDRYNENPNICNFKNLSKEIISELKKLIEVINVYNPKNKQLKEIDEKINAINIKKADSYELTELLSNLSLDINNLQVNLFQEERDNLKKLSYVLSKINSHLENSLTNNIKQREKLSKLSQEITVDLRGFNDIELNSSSTLTGIKSEITKNTNKLKNRVASFIIDQEDLVNQQEKDIQRQKIEMIKMQEKMAAMEKDLKEIKKISYLDNLTGIQNRKSYEEFSKETNKEWNKNKTNTSILILDIDHFKKINDNYGHCIGDEALKYFGKILKRVDNLYKTATSFRYGGEEFVVIVKSLKEEEVLNLAKKIRNTISKHSFKPKEGIDIELTVSIGVSHFKGKYDTVEKVFCSADKALYKSKEKRNSISVEVKNKIRTI
jgi:diguanylate cyclase (GGDEF)-like protein